MLAAQELAVDLEKSYLHDVLKLEDGETEEMMDEALQREAQELFVDVDAAQQASLVRGSVTKPLSTRTFSSDAPRRSGSITSSVSQSTDMTSNVSEISREIQRPARSRASLSFRDYDNFMARGVPNGRNSISFSPPTTPSHSTFSLPMSSPSSSPKRHFRKIRGLSMLKLSRAGSSSSAMNGCPHCPQDLLSQRRAVHKLPCGHRLCTQALRNTVKSATDGKPGCIPSCCGVPISGTLVEQVMTQQEQEALLDAMAQWEEASSIAPSVASDMKEPSAMAKRSCPMLRTTSSDSKVDSLTPNVHATVGKLHERQELLHLQQDHADLRNRLLGWIERQRLDLEARHEILRTEMKALHETATEDLLEHHASAMAEAEDKQVKAEADLREMHSREERDNATALKHMEAFCAGTYAGTGECHNRLVTDQDRLELEKARRVRNTMDTKHGNAINVLRGEQSRRIRLRTQRQEKEEQDLRCTQRKEELELERACTGEMHRFNDLVEEKRKRMRTRCETQTMCCAKKLELDNGVLLRGSVQNVEWQADSTTGSGAGKEGISTGFAVSG